MDGATDDDDALLGLTFRGCEGLPPELDPRVIGAAVLELPEHHDLETGGATVDWLFRIAEKRKHGRRILGTCYMPSVQGDLSDLFDHLLAQHCGRAPDFLIVLDWIYWRDTTPLGREILCFHELKHAVQARDIYGGPRFDREGMPIWAINAHDIEEFDDVVRRYGVHSADVERFLSAVAEHMEEGR
jgi:Putative phage metallopeptidase